MLAVTRHEYGPPDVLRVEQLPTPEPAPAEIAVDVRAVVVTAADLKSRSLQGIPASMYLPARAIFGLVRPNRQVLGISFAGVVVDGADRFAAGTRVVGGAGLRLGACAERVVVPGDAVMAELPEHVSFEQAAPLTHGGLTAVHFLRRAELSAGESILIHGGSGASGSFAVQLARGMGATVAASCSPAKFDFVRQLGAEEVFDYHHLPPDRKFDVILDTHGSMPYRRAKPMLRAGGRLLRLAFGLGGILKTLLPKFGRKHRVICDVAQEKSDDLADLVARLADGSLRSPVDRTFPLAEAVDAHRYAESGTACGAVILQP